MGRRIWAANGGTNLWLDMAICAYNLILQEAESGRSQVPSSLCDRVRHFLLKCKALKKVGKLLGAQILTGRPETHAEVVTAGWVISRK